MSLISFHYFRFRFFFIPSVIIALLFSFSLIIISCSPTTRIGRNSTKQGVIPGSIRLFIEEFNEPRSIRFRNDIYFNPGSGPIRVPGNTLINIRIIEGEINLRFGRHNYKGLNFTIEPFGKMLKYNGKDFNGEIKFVINNSQIQVINYINIEEYLKGVIQGEMEVANNDKDFQALKAFTICARNFAYMKTKESRKNYDVFGDTRDQVYSVYKGEKPLVNKAVEETRGLVLLYGDEPAQTFYYSSCGGWTEDYENVFSRDKIKYLSSIRDGNVAYCSISPSFSWTEKYSFSQITEFLRSAKLLDNKNYSIKSISVKSRFPSGRINELEITLSEDKSMILQGNNIRYVIRSGNGGILKSTLCDVSIKGSTVVFEGKGYGHGVGLCQWGAIGQSRKGKSFEEILYFYFPGTKIGRIELAYVQGNRGLHS